LWKKAAWQCQWIDLSFQEIADGTNNSCKQKGAHCSERFGQDGRVVIHALSSFSDALFDHVMELMREQETLNQHLDWIPSDRCVYQ